MGLVSRESVERVRNRYISRLERYLARHDLHFRQEGTLFAYSGTFEDQLGFVWPFGLEVLESNLQ